MILFRENLREIIKAFEFQSVAAWVEEEHCCLFADLACEADLWLDDELDAFCFSFSANSFHASIGRTIPKCGTGTSSAST